MQFTTLNLYKSSFIFREENFFGAILYYQSNQSKEWLYYTTKLLGLKREPQKE